MGQAPGGFWSFVFSQPRPALPPSRLSIVLELKKGWYQEVDFNSMPVGSGRRKHLQDPKMFFFSRKFRQSAIHPAQQPKSPLTGLYLVVSWLTFRII